ncbi:GntR family transcriptional regulator [Burkholderia sp. WAC0059]|uniref:LacI family DNA-binding transcriptional regulator n=1 Tax=Burkholderia sp. WAC0059 TaxID=2066022 RepID=UPI000C7F4402|nr:LacI family DNA-binding transcriptional regulator [Burkholderia sp. WAC0059]PLZ02926.1 GntR family transcriptional regulator [Burkholderia sp. WAC0059]
MTSEAFPAATRRVKKTSTGSSTLEDVARKSGVSAMTVSRALNRPELVSATTRDRVWQAVEEIGYIPNLLAGALASNRSRLVAVMLPTMANSIFAGYIQALTERLAAAGYQVMLGLTNYSFETEEALLATVISRRPDGIVLTGTQHSARSLKLLGAAKIPVVETWDKVQAPLDMLVGFSHFDVGRDTAGYLLDRGYRRFGLLWLDDVRGTLRREGFMQALAQRGIAPAGVSVVAAPASQQLGREGLDELLRQDPSIDAIVCSSDELAFGVLAEANRRGIRMPDDLALMGYGDLSAAAHTYPSLTTVKVNSATIGAKAAEVLLARLQPSDPSSGGDGSRAHGGETRIDTGFEIVQREST